MANTDFYLNNYRYFIANIHGRILTGFDTISECRDYIKYLLDTDLKEIGGCMIENFYGIYFNKGGHLGKKVQ